MASVCKEKIPSSFLAAIQIIRDFPPARTLIDSVREEGDFKFVLADISSDARWHPIKRQVMIRRSAVINGELDKNSQAALMIFELCNAKRSQKFLELDAEARQSQIEKTLYVRRVEALEYASAMESMPKVQQAVKDNLFPSDVRGQFYFTDFPLFLKYHELDGHAQRIARRFEALNLFGAHQKYKSSWKPAFHKSDQRALLNLLRLKGRCLYMEPAEKYKEQLAKQIAAASKRVLDAAVNFLEPSELNLKRVEVDFGAAVVKRELFEDAQSSSGEESVERCEEKR